MAAAPEGIAALDLLLGYSDLVRNAIVHEVPLARPQSISASLSRT